MSTLNELRPDEIPFVGGGDAAATRTAGQNAWGESPPSSSSLVRELLRVWGCEQGVGTCTLF